MSFFDPKSFTSKTYGLIVQAQNVSTYIHRSIYSFILIFKNTEVIYNYYQAIYNFYGAI